MGEFASGGVLAIHLRRRFVLVKSPPEVVWQIIFGGGKCGGNRLRRYFGKSPPEAICVGEIASGGSVSNYIRRR